MIAIDTINIIPATLADYPIIQNMARFYVSDMSRYCGFISSDRACPENWYNMVYYVKKF